MNNPNTNYNYNQYQPYQQNNAVKTQEDLKTSYYYSEKYQKPRRKKNIILPLLLVALISSILGGSIAGAIIYFGIPTVGIQGIEANVGDAIFVEKTQSNAGVPVKTIEIVDQTESPITAIAEKVSPSIVGIKTTYQVNDWFFGAYNNGGEGSGIIIESDGYIMTNNHVIESALIPNSSSEQVEGAKIEVYLPNQTDTPYEATVIGRDPKTDLAVLKIEASELPAVEFGDSTQLKVGELAVAIGNPAGIEYMGSVTSGIISGLNRTVPVTNDQYLKLIQTDASINPGNSGGALLNSVGEVIGVNTAKIGGSGYEGLGFAIPINTAKEVVNDLIQHKYVTGRPYIGIQVETRFTEEIAEANNVPMGVYVDAVVPFSGAANAGMKERDIITKINGNDVTNFEELEKVKTTHAPGDSIMITVYRMNSNSTVGEYIDIELILGEDKGGN